MKNTLLFVFSVLLLNQVYSQTPFISIAEPRYEIGAKLIEVDSKIELIGKFDSSGLQYIFRNQYASDGTLESSNSNVSPFEQGQFSITEIVMDSLSNYYCVGTFYSDTTTDLQIGIAKFDNLFTLVDAYVLGQESVSESAYDVIINSKGNIVVGGYAGNLDKAFLYEYSLIGESIQEVVFVEDTTWLGILGIIEDTSNSRYISSQTKFSLSIIDSESFDILDENPAQIKDSSYLIRYLYNLPSSSDFLASYIQYSSFETPFTNYYLSRVSSDLDTSWTISFGDVASDILSFPNSLVMNDSNNIWQAYISCNNCGNFLYENVSHTISILKFRSDGAIVGEYYINSDYNLGYLSASSASDNGIYIVASLYNWDLPENDLDIVVFKLDSLGNITTNTSDFEPIVNQINVFPNPVSENLHFQSQILTTGYQIEIFQIDGTKVINHMCENGITNVDVSQLESGIYVYRILDNGKKLQVGKFIKN